MLGSGSCLRFKYCSCSIARELWSRSTWFQHLFNIFMVTFYLIELATSVALVEATRQHEAIELQVFVRQPSPAPTFSLSNYFFRVPVCPWVPRRLVILSLSTRASGRILEPRRRAKLRNLHTSLQRRELRCLRTIIMSFDLACRGNTLTSPRVPTGMRDGRKTLPYNHNVYFS